jgi:hypothetical protein
VMAMVPVSTAKVPNLPAAPGLLSISLIGGSPTLIVIVSLLLSLGVQILFGGPTSYPVWPRPAKVMLAAASRTDGGGGVALYWYAPMSQTPAGGM